MRPEHATTSRYWTHWYWRSDLSILAWFEDVVKAPTCRPLLTLPTWTFSRIWQSIWTRKADTCFWTHWLINFGSLQAILTTSAWWFCTYLHSLTPKLFRWVESPNLIIWLHSKVLAMMIKQLYIVASCWTREYSQCWDWDPELIIFFFCARIFMSLMWN